MLPSTWKMHDELRAPGISRGVWISSRVWATWQASQSEASSLHHHRRRRRNIRHVSTKDSLVSLLH